MITKNYIRMCEKAKQIQKLWIPGLGDICINKTDNEEVMIVASRGKIADKEYKFVYLGIGGREQRDYWHKKDQLIWLPTQGQLQEMINIREYWFSIMFKEGKFIFTYLYDINNKNYQSFKGNSIKECLLKLIMKEKYNKIWTGNDWQVKEG